MAKKALLDVLEQTIGKYVRNLDAESLNVAIWSGKIELNSLRLDCDSVNAEISRQAAEAPNLAIPFKVVSGVFEHFEVDVPWSQLMSRSVVLRASGLIVEVEPFNHTETSDYLRALHENEATRAKQVQDQRDQSINLAEKYRNQANALRDLAAQDLESSLTQSSQTNTNSTFATRLVRRIIENIQIEIMDVKIIVQGADCSAGVLLDSLTLVTTDKDGKRVFVDRTAGNSNAIDNSFLYKNLRIAGFGIYLDEDKVTVTRLSTITEDNDNNSVDHSYVLAPLSFEASLRQADSNICVEYPKYLLSSELRSMSVLLSKPQLESAYRILEQMRPSFDVAKPLFPEYRPLQRVSKETVLIWWKYAVRCIGRLNGRRSWVEFFRAFQRRQLYISLYKRYAHHEKSPWIKELLPWEVAQLRTIEMDRSISVDGIMAWRNIADAQVRKEQEKHDANQAKAKSSIFSSLFGGSQSGIEAPPIKLSTEELKALESLSEVQLQDSELSSDSKLCDVQFVLGSFRIDVSSFRQHPIVSLEMGSVSSVFEANQDGSYTFDLALTSLDVHDRYTLNTFFPTILTNKTNNVPLNGIDKVLTVMCSKSKKGDQHIRIKLRTCEAIASPSLLIQLKQFVNHSKNIPASGKSSKTNPLLAQSLSGSIDLFYDASEGSDRIKEDIKLDRNHDGPGSVVIEDLSNTLIDAWRKKEVAQTSWVIDLDLQAPIVVIPESCTAPRANILVFDLGNLIFQYGKVENASNKVENWFRTYPSEEKPGMKHIEHGSVRISSLTFSLGKVNYWRRMVRKHESSSLLNDEEAIIEPISLSIDFGIESIIGLPPRICAVGVLPSISLRLSPGQLSKIINVLNSWKSTLREVLPVHEDITSTDDSIDIANRTFESNSLSLPANSKVPASISTTKSMSVIHPILFIEFGLQKLLIKVLDDADNGIEANLVAVNLSMTSFSDGSLQSVLSMGWFWIMDRFYNDFPRKQRLVVHSELPTTIDVISDKSFDILAVLHRSDESTNDFEKSGSLAKISFRQSATGTNFGPQDPYAVSHDQGVELAVSSKIDAHFSRLFINWNPRAVKAIMSMVGRFVQSIGAIEPDEIVITSPTQLARNRRYSVESIQAIETNETLPSTTIISATMDGLQISLNSALDDMPLFIGTMASTRLSAIVSSDDSMRLFLAIDDLQINSPAMGRTDPDFRTIFGLAFGKADGILSVHYNAGKKALALLPESNNGDISGCDAFGEVNLSPMRMVYIQAQILALVEYATAGILGVVTAKAAASAAQAATDLANATDTKKKFIVRAGGFELILPQAAYLAQYLSASIETLLVDFTIMPDSSVEASVSINEFTITDMVADSLLEVPVHMDFKVEMKPENIGSKDDQAIRVTLSISSANFVVSKPHYTQLLATLDENIGEQDLFLRDSAIPLDLLGDDSSIDDGGIMDLFTHAGSVVIDNPRRIFVSVAITSLGMTLCGVDQFDPILRLSAADAVFDMKMLPDCEKMIINVTLRDLSCDDNRLKSMSRQYRSLIYQIKKGQENLVDDVFFASYETSKDNTSFVVLKVGSPRIVFIPDVLSDLMKYLSVDRKKAPLTEKKVVIDKVAPREVVAIDVDDQDDFGIETTVVNERKVNQVSTFSLSLKTAQCTLLLVDLGSDAVPRQSGAPVTVTSVAETLVLGGIFEISATIETDEKSGVVVKAATQLHADAIEAYTAFGRDLDAAIQILDPTKFSLYVNLSSTIGKSQTLDIRCAAISPINMTLSMRNVALVNAIMTSVFDCTDTEISESVQDKTVPLLNQQDASRLEHLVQVLDAESISIENSKQESSFVDNVSTDKASHVSESSTQLESTFTLTTPESTICLVNDLQGLDDALIRFSFRNIVANGTMKTGVRSNIGGPPFTGFEFNFHTSVVADYFDSSKNIWKVLLVQPWELSAKGSRGTSRRFESNRPSTTIDIDSLPCHLSFSEQFLMSLASAHRMWSVYSAATESALNSLDQASQQSVSLRRSMAATAARTFITSLPYAIENHCGISIQFLVNAKDDDRRTCESGSIEYFKFEPPGTESSTGGKRLYGQDVIEPKKLVLFIGKHSILLSNIDTLIGEPKLSHNIGIYGVLVSDVVKEGKTIMVHVSSGVDIFNRTLIPFDIAVYQDGTASDVGTCDASSLRPHGNQSEIKHSRDGKFSKLSRRFGIPVGLVAEFRNDFDQKKDAMIALSFSPKIDCGHADWELIGGTKLRMNGNTMSKSFTHSTTERYQITCRPIFQKGQSNDNAPRDISSFIFQVVVSMLLINGKDPAIEIAIEPRATLYNKIPISIALTTPMPHVFSLSQENIVHGVDVNHSIDQNEHIEIFSPGPSIAVIMKIADVAIGGTATDWVLGGWIDLPLIPEFRLLEPLECMFPFIQNSMDYSNHSGYKGIDFSIVQGTTSLSNLSSSSHEILRSESNNSSVEMSAPVTDNEDWLSFFVTVRNYGIDHTGDVLFERVKVSTDTSIRRSSSSIPASRSSSTLLQSPPIGAYSTKQFRGRVSLLPGNECPLRLLHLNMEGDDGLRKSLPFQIDDISICDGGIDSTPIKWEDGTLSGFFAYRQLVTPYQSEIHIIPEYIVFNGSEQYSVFVRQPSGVEFMVKAGNISPLRRHTQETAVIRLEYPGIGAFTNPLRIDALGLRIAILKTKEGFIMGSVAIQNVVGDRNSRFVVKIGELNVGSAIGDENKTNNPYDMLKDDYFRFRVKWSELRLTLNEARPIAEGNRAFLENALDHIQKVSTPVKPEQRTFIRTTPSKSETWVEAREKYIQERAEASVDDTEKAVCTILFTRFTVDWQRVFKVDDSKEGEGSDRGQISNAERSQFAMVIHSVQIRDETVGTAFPVVFDSNSQLVSFFDLCIRFRGQSSSELVVVDLLDLNLSHVNGVSEKMYLNTDEDFVWKVLDLADRILVAAAEFAGVDVQLDWDDENEGYIVKIKEKSTKGGEETKYTPPKSDTIYHIKKTRISPFKLVVSFKRNPQSTRYKLHRGVKGANIMNYFTRRLKFKIDKAELGFAQYEVNDVKGPPDRFIELISNVYMARMKTKVVTIMSAASFQDWKSLAMREEGDDAYVDGDILRATGNVAGTTVNYVLKSAGQGIGTGVSTVTSSLGDGIEAASAAIGVRGLGAGVNSVVTGVGDGVSDTISGVGSGAGKVLKSVGQGAGQAFGGVAGGVLLVGKGLGKGITQGDGRAVASGLLQGGAAVGTGVGQGLESVVTGTAQGVMNVGQGLFSGVKSVGKGFGGAFTEWCSCFSCCIEQEEAERNGALSSPLLPRHENVDE